MSSKRCSISSIWGLKPLFFLTFDIKLIHTKQIQKYEPYLHSSSSSKQNIMGLVMEHSSVLRRLNGRLLRLTTGCQLYA